MIDQLQPFTLALLLLILTIAIYQQFTQKTRHFPAKPFQNYYPFQATILFGKDSDAFLQSCCQKLGNVFSVYLVNQYTVFVTSEEDFAAINKCKDLSFDPAMKAFEERVTRLSKQGLELSYAPDQLLRDHKNIRSLMNNSAVDDLLKRGLSIMNTRLDEIPGTGSFELQAFANDLVFEISTRAVFGDSFYTHSLKPDFDEFASKFALLMAGTPHALVPSATKSIDNLTNAFMEGLKTHEFEDACDFIKTRVAQKKSDGHSLSDQAKSEVGILLAVNANLINGIFWSTYYLYRKEQAKTLQDIRSELEEHLDLKDYSTWTKENLEKCVLLNSCIMESLRLTSASFPLRLALKDCILQLPSGPVSLFKGDQVMLVASPRWKQEKGYDFVPDRFMTRQSDVLLFGFGNHMCTGRNFALSIIKAFVANLIVRFEKVEIAFDQEPKKDMSAAGQGILPPTKESRIDFKYQTKGL